MFHLKIQAGRAHLPVLFSFSHSPTRFKWVRASMRCFFNPHQRKPLVFCDSACKSGWGDPEKTKKNLVESCCRNRIISDSFS